MTSDPSPRVARFDTAGGRVVYRLRIEVFPGFTGNAYVVDDGARPILVDTGSGSERSDADLRAALAELVPAFGRRIALRDLEAVIVTHGHIDHFGGVHGIRRESGARFGIHPLDRRVLASYGERLIVASHALDLFFHAAGVDELKRRRYIATYRETKNFFAGGFQVDFTFEEGSLAEHGLALEAYHVPGHCPGQVCLRVDDVLLTADHVLERISPHLAPEAITSETGVGHYLASLAKIERLEGIRLGLGGHLGAIEDIPGRIAVIRRQLHGRLDQVLDLCATPRRIVDVSRAIYGQVRSYHVLLAILEAGALVEYLYQRGDLVAANLDDLERDTLPAFLYQRA
jgi:glyoxylase-like metal-dependent hydrolase (beta-lactamase superfamily II)